MTTRRTTCAAALALTALLAGCSGGGSATGPTSTATGRSAAASTGGAGGAGEGASSSPSTSAAPSDGAPPATVTLALAGDSNTAWTARRVLRDGVGPMSEHLRAADVAVVNLETLVVDDEEGLVAEPKAFNFVTGPKIVERMHEAGVDVLSGANNHTMDYKVEGMRRMLATRLPVPVIGIGADPEEAARPWRTTVRGRSVVVFAANDVETDGLDWSAKPGQPGQLVVTRQAGLDRLLAGIREERAKDGNAVIVAFMHWGLEPETCQNPRQVELAQLMAEAGADVVAGGHSHRLEPVVTIPGAGGRTTLVAYGLGNFVFNRKTTAPETGRTGVLTVTVPGRGAPVPRFDPAYIVDGIPRPLRGAEREQALEAYRTHPDRCARTS